MTEPRRRKLIEVALPLEAINRASAREKSIRHGHPSTLHLWWARRPLAACRAVLFAQLVDDPSARPDLYPTEADQAVKRKELFDLVERLVVWENSNNQALLDQAHREILASTDGHPPAVLDPFAGGGSIPLEAQRLGLETHASDLNPVAVLINKALVEIPPHWAGHPPVFPGAAGGRLGDWPGATGLAEDVRRYGKWMRDEAQRRVGHLYPKATLPDGSQAEVIAWIWARTVTCQNPACSVETPLVNSFTVSSKRAASAHVRPVVRGTSISYDIETTAAPSTSGTVSRTGARCVVCGASMPLSYVRAEGQSGRLGARLICIVAEGNRRRVYLPPTAEHETAARVAAPPWVPDVDLPVNPRAITTANYGITSHADLYTRRQLTLLGCLTGLAAEARQRCRDDGAPREYADALAVYIALLIGRVANRSSSQSFWHPGRSTVEQVFGRNAMPMIWVYAEGNPFSDSTGNVLGQLDYLAKAIDRLPATTPAGAALGDAVELATRKHAVIATDPPYYDNVPYADLSDFFYVWHRACLRDILPELYATVVTPKHAELIAEPARAGSQQAAAAFFEAGLRRFFQRAVLTQDDQYPMTLFYAFKQAETDHAGTASTGWETMLQALLDAGAAVVATWPVRTEMAGGLRELGRNALASSVVLACRRRGEHAQAVSRRSFRSALKEELPHALREMQQGSIAPVDLAQATVGPGMAIFSRSARVVEADGTDMTVRTALALINQALDEVLSEQEGDFDADTRFCLTWFEQHGFNEGAAGEADNLSRAKNTSVGGLEQGGVFHARAGKAWLLAPEDLPPRVEFGHGERISVWMVVMHLAKALTEFGSDEAARVMAAVGSRIDLDTAKELAYLLYSICERRGWAQTALLFNGLGTSWNDLAAAAKGAAAQTSGQGALDFEG